MVKNIISTHCCYVFDFKLKVCLEAFPLINFKNKLTNYLHSVKNLQTNLLTGHMNSKFLISVPISTDNFKF